MKGWSIRFKDRQPDEAEMTFLAKEFYRDLVEESVTSEEFSAADRHVCKGNRFFPVMADIMSVITEHRERERVAYIARAKWRRENEWKKNHPELLTADERIELGVPLQAIEAAVDRGDLDKKAIDQMISGLACTKVMD
jgi:hypothetical protein